MFLRLPTTYTSIVSILLFSLFIFSGQFCADGIEGETENYFFAAMGETEPESFSEVCQNLKELSDRLLVARRKIVYTSCAGSSVAANIVLVPLVAIAPGMVHMAASATMWACLNGRPSVDRMAARLINLSKDFKNRFVLYGPSIQEKIVLMHKLTQETDGLLLEVDWNEIKKKYAYKGSQGIKEFFDQIQADFERMRIETPKEIPMASLFIKGADELIDGSTVIARKFNLELDKRKNSPQHLFILETNKTTISTGNVLEGLIGKSPVKVRYFINQLKEVDVALKTGQPLPAADCKNRLLLYGPPGNGKTTIAQKIAEQTGSHYIYINAPELMNKYFGGSAANIKKIFDDARTYADLNIQKIVIGLDEIDAIADKIVAEHKSEPLAALQELWHQLDLIQNDSRFLFIGMTNVEEVHPTLKTRFGNNIEKIGAPDRCARKSALQLYKKKFTGTRWNKQILKKLLDNTEDKEISMRFIEDYVREVHMVAKNDNDNVITDELAWDIFKEMKVKYVEGFWARKKRQVQTKENWDTALRVAAIAVPVAVAATTSTPALAVGTVAGAAGAVVNNSAASPVVAVACS